MPRAGRVGQSDRDRAVRGRLLVERNPLSHGNGLRASLRWMKSGNENEEGDENVSEPGAYVRVV
jgi:hypothetical protein